MPKVLLKKLRTKTSDLDLGVEAPMEFLLKEDKDEVQQAMGLIGYEQGMNPKLNIDPRMPKIDARKWPKESSPQALMYATPMATYLSKMKSKREYVGLIMGLILGMIKELKDKLLKGLIKAQAHSSKAMQWAAH